MRLVRDTLCQVGTLDNYVGTGTNVTLGSNVTMVSFESMATVPTFDTFVLNSCFHDKMTVPNESVPFTFYEIYPFRVRQKIQKFVYSHIL